MLDEIHGECFICQNWIDTPSVSSSMKQHGMRFGYIGGNGKTRIYCMACIVKALHIYTLARPEMKKLAAYEQAGY